MPLNPLKGTYLFTDIYKGPVMLVPTEASGGPVTPNNPISS